jgi:hypothetical protein
VLDIQGPMDIDVRICMHTRLRPHAPSASDLCHTQLTPTPTSAFQLNDLFSSPEEATHISRKVHTKYEVDRENPLDTGLSSFKVQSVSIVVGYINPISVQCPGKSIPIRSNLI